MIYNVSELRNDRMVDDILRTQRLLENQLFNDIDHDDLEIRFVIDPDIESGDESEVEVHGYCVQEDYRDYLIELRNGLRGEPLIRTVIHELVHVKQYVTGRLEQEHIDDRGPKMYWNTIDMSHVEYDDQPWEQEAEQLENELFERFLSL